MEADKQSPGTSRLERRADLSNRMRGEAYGARTEALKIAFAPFVFQAARVLKESGMLAELHRAGDLGLTFAELRASTGFSKYGLRVLLDSAESSGIVKLRFADEHDDEPHSFITKVGYFLETDELTRVQFDFTSEVCYQGLAKLEESLRESKPAGLSFLGPWKTVYRGLSSLPKRVKEAWLAFDHFFSDEAFGELLRRMEQLEPAKILDVGGNTGRLSQQLLKRFTSATVTIADLPQQIAMAKEASHSYIGRERLDFYPIDVLGDESLPSRQDAVVMSQFLDCFSEAEIVTILKKARQSLNSGGQLYILETLIDRQQYQPGQFCVAQISLYFTAIANGNSQMYRYATLHRCITAAGFEVKEVVDHIGRGHSLLVCT